MMIFATIDQKNRKWDWKKEKPSKSFRRLACNKYCHEMTCCHVTCMCADGQLWSGVRPPQSCSRLTWTLLPNPLRPGILLAKVLGAVRALVELRSRPGFIPLSDSFMNDINKWTHPVSCLYFRSQRNEHESFWKHTVTQTHVSPSDVILLCCFIFGVQACAWWWWWGGGSSFSYLNGSGPTVKHIKFDHLSPGSSPGVAWLSVALWHRQR